MKKILVVGLICVALIIVGRNVWKDPRFRAKVDHIAGGNIMRATELSDMQVKVHNMLEKNAENENLNCLGTTPEAKERTLTRLLNIMENGGHMSPADKVCLQKVDDGPFSFTKIIKEKTASFKRAVSFSEPDPVWTQVTTFGYTPNKPDWTTFPFVAPEDGHYRPVCKSGYNQHNIPSHGNSYIKPIPCKGSWLPHISTMTGFSNHQVAEQLVNVNGQDLTGGQKSIHLRKGMKVLISVMPNIGKVRSKSPNREAVFAQNTGTVRFSIERLIAR